jgi:hypothetical protein
MAIRVTPNLIKRKRGGQRKHWAENARVWAWYCNIKNRCDWSDYVLDYEFAWTDEGRASRADNDDRPRTFENIRKHSRKPAGRDIRWRDIDALVMAIDQHPLFQGTREIYMSEFWDLLQLTTLTISDVKVKVDKILESKGLVRVDTRKSKEFSELIEKHGQEHVFDRCLMLSLKKLDGLSAITLTWLLYLQTEPIHNSAFRKIVLSIADNQLDYFFSRDYSIKDHLSKYSDAVDVLLNFKLDMSKRNFGGYGFLEVYGVWPIVPLEMVGSILDDDVFSINIKDLTKLYQ